MPLIKNLIIGPETTNNKRMRNGRAKRPYGGTRVQQVSKEYGTIGHLDRQRPSLSLLPPVMETKFCHGQPSANFGRWRQRMAKAEGDEAIFRRRR